MPSDANNEIAEKSQNGPSSQSSIYAEIDAGRSDLLQRQMESSDEQRNADRPPTHVSRVFGRSAAILEAADKASQNPKTDYKDAMTSQSPLGGLEITDNSSKAGSPRPNIQAENSERPLPREYQPMLGGLVDAPTGRVDEKPTTRDSDSRPEHIKELERKFAEEIARTGRIPQDLKVILENPSSPNGVSIAKINELLNQQNSPHRLSDERGTNGEVSLNSGGKKLDAYTPKRKEQPGEQTDPDFEARAKLERAIADKIIANGGKVPQELVDMLSGKGDKNGVAIRIDEINLMLAASCSNMRLSQGKTKEGFDTLTVTEGGQVREKWVFFKSEEFGIMPVKVAPKAEKPAEPAKPVIAPYVGEPNPYLE